MATLAQLRQGLGQVWETMVEGWQNLTRRAANALTRFSLPGKDEDEYSLQEYRRRNLGWGLLAAEVFDDGKRVIVRMEAPGMSKDDFDIEILDDVLIVRGEKQVERESSQGRYHVLECAYGSFERAVPLPGPVDHEGAKAKYRKGVLRIELPLQRPLRGTRQIPIR